MLTFISGQGHFGLSLIVVALSRVKGSMGYKDWHAMSEFTSRCFLALEKQICK